MARHWLVLTLAATALGAGCVAALDRDTGTRPVTTNIAPPAAPPTTTRTESTRQLDPGLARAFATAAQVAAEEGHRLTITSGFRTRAEQQALLNAEIKKRGSVGEALRWVFTPDRSMHVRGLAIDVGDRRAAEWLDAAGSRFGLCRTLAWEWWHFEWRDTWEQKQWCPRPADEPADAPT